MILLAFDVDGTLDSSAGPVRWTKVKAIEFAMRPLLAVGIVSPSGARPNDGTKAYLPNGGSVRHDNLLAFAADHPEAMARIYVSNNADFAEAEAAGFAYLSDQEFARGIA